MGIVLGSSVADGASYANANIHAYANANIHAFAHADVHAFAHASVVRPVRPARAGVRIRAADRDSANRCARARIRYRAGVRIRAGASAASKRRANSRGGKGILRQLGSRSG